MDRSLPRHTTTTTTIPSTDQSTNPINQRTTKLLIIVVSFYLLLIVLSHCLVCLFDLVLSSSFVYAHLFSLSLSLSVFLHPLTVHRSLQLQFDLSFSALSHR